MSWIPKFILSVEMGGIFGGCGPIDDEAHRRVKGTLTGLSHPRQALFLENPFQDFPVFSRRCCALCVTAAAQYDVCCAVRTKHCCRSIFLRQILSNKSLGVAVAGHRPFHYLSFTLSLSI